MYNEHIMHMSLLLDHCVVYPGASTRVGSKHIPGMMIPYSPVTKQGVMRYELLIKY